MARPSSIALRRWAAFKANRRGYVSLWIVLGVLAVTSCAEFLANDRPLLVGFRGDLYVPVIRDYPETAFGGTFATTADYRDAAVAALITADGWMLWPPVRFDARTVNFSLAQPAPSPPTAENWLGTDDQGRDVLARLIYGLRLSLLFGLALTAASSVIGVAAGVVQGYFGGPVDLVLQRAIEIWGGMPQLLILIIVSAVVAPGFWTLLGVLLLFSWTALVAVVRAEVLRTRNFDYIRAARALGVRDGAIMLRHILPNAMVATLTFLPFVLAGAVVALASLDFLGLGLPPGAPSLGELLRQGKENLQAPWLAFTGFVAMAGLLMLLIFVGEAVRDALDPRKAGP